MCEDERRLPEFEKAAPPSREPPRRDEFLPAAVGGRAIRWDAVAAIIAACIGFLSLIVAGYTAYEQRISANILLRQTRAQVWPYLEIGVSPFIPSEAIPGATDSSDIKQGVAFMIANRGVGPAIIRGVEVDVKGKPQPDWAHVFRALGLQKDAPGNVSGTLSGRVLAPGQHVFFLMLPGKAQWSIIRPKLAEMTIRTCYCSTLGECWEYSTFANAKGAQPVKACTRIPRGDQFTQ